MGACEDVISDLKRQVLKSRVGCPRLDVQLQEILSTDISSYVRYKVRDKSLAK